ncbi:MAG: hypothetical protein ABSA11_15625 [Candidatus Bathyarchaeia archaeon]
MAGSLLLNEWPTLIHWPVVSGDFAGATVSGFLDESRLATQPI